MVRKKENIQWAAVVWKMACWCQRRMCRLVRDDRKATVSQLTTRYNQGLQNTISVRTTRRTLKQMGSSSRRPHRVPLRSAKNRKQRLFIQHLDMSHLWGWMDYFGKGEVLTNIDLWTIFERNCPFVYIEKVLDLRVQLMKNGGKNKSVAFII